MVLLEMSITPMGAGQSVSEHVAKCVQLITESGLAYEVHSMGTIVEGELPEVLSLMQSCVERLAEDHERVSCIAKLDYRAGATDRLRGKVASVEQHLGVSLQPQQ
ncbi:MAG: MTH1187 family thiamine-binding protein [Planctomycetota bacterium]